MTLQFKTQASTVTSDAALFVIVLCPLNILPVKADDGDGGGSSAGEIRGWPAVIIIIIINQTFIMRLLLSKIRT